MTLNDLPADGKPDTGPLILGTGVQALKWVEDAIQIFFLDVVIPNLSLGISAVRRGAVV